MFLVSKQIMKGFRPIFFAEMFYELIAIVTMWLANAEKKFCFEQIAFVCPKYILLLSLYELKQRLSMRVKWKDFASLTDIVA